MAYEFKLPDLGEGIEEAELLSWAVSEGEQVDAYQVLCQVESAKAAVELTAPVAGRIGSLHAHPGDTVRRGAVLVTIDTVASESPAASADSVRAVEAEPSDAEWFGIVGRPPAVSASGSGAYSDLDFARAEPERRPVRAAPFVRKLARELNVQLEDVQGSGPQGRIRAADLEAHARPQADRIPLSGLRKRIADHMVEAVRNAPQVTAMDLFDVTELFLARQLLQASGQADTAHLGYLPFFVKASIAALQAVPEANAVLDKDSIVLQREYHIGIATAVPGGLVVPVVKHADRLTLVQLNSEIDRLATAARERRATPNELKGGTFTITSFGGLPGSPMFATPILNYPEVAILGVGRIEPQPRVVDNQIVPRHCVGISFTFDHRVMDGEAAGRFMAVLRRYLEQPLQFLLRLT